MGRSAEGSPSVILEVVPGRGSEVQARYGVKWRARPESNRRPAYLRKNSLGTNLTVECCSSSQPVRLPSVLGALLNPGQLVRS